MRALSFETRLTSKDGVLAIPIESLIQPISRTLAILVALVGLSHGHTLRILLELHLFDFGIVPLELKQMWRTFKHEVKLFLVIEFGWEHLPRFIERDHS